MARRRCCPRVARRSAQESSVTSTSTGLVRSQVAVDRPPVERPLVHEEAEHEMVAGEALEEPAQALARAQAPADGSRTIRSPERVVADERDASVRAHAAGGRLADVVQQRAEAERLAAGELVGQRLASTAAQGVPDGLERLELDLAPSTSIVCPYTSRWW